VAAFSAVQAQLADELDPVSGGGIAVFNGTIFNELRSNESVINNVLVFSFGGGQFAIQNTSLFIDSSPNVDPNTGAVISGPNDADRELVEGEDYTIDPGGTGEETIELDASVNLAPGVAIYIRHRVETPSVAEAEVFESNFRWTAAGEISGLNFDQTPDESTTVLP
jgi:hypothetical protein